MPLEIVTVPCLTDNYAYLLHEAGGASAAVVDVPDAAPVARALRDRGLRLTDILITHHHQDHVAGVDALRDAHGARVIGAAADAHRLPRLDLAVAPGDRIAVGGETAEILDVAGHTLGHIAYHFPDSSAVFTGDSLMALGCGRLFEGDAAMMWTSLSRLAALPPGTLVYSGHEYTAANARFALTIEPENSDLRRRAEEVDALRAAGRPTVPARLSDELATNPFLRAHRAEMKAALGMTGAADVDVFAEIRARKDRF